MNIYAHPEALTFLADHYDGDWHPWPFFWIFPVVFWLAVIGVIVVSRRARWRDRGIGTLRTAFARGEIDEDQYLTRLEVLRRTRRPRRADNH
ncbi:putative membrane protein [Nocardia transvalensis]|uniref:Putative membrane protein n=1 Tax=Nocardia transvalensis TaxID=37333 RepID=A0A7W9PC18_9NOCA|nr:hypothetical protein [Nocardia transvalensis]MBB5913332.1 putative membrane protein [Nocardia transvalensis]